MLRVRLLHVLDRLLSGEAAHRAEALGSLDPISRPFVALALDRALSRAAGWTSVEEPMHRYRLAFVAAAGQRPPTVPDDEAAVRHLVDGLRADRPGPPRAWVPSVALLGLVAVVGAAAALAFQDRRLEPLHEELSPTAAAYAQGGRAPPGSEAARRFLSTTLPAYAAAPDDARRAAAEAEGRRALGETLAPALAALLFEAQVVGAPDRPLDGETAEGFLETVAAFNDALGRADLPYFTDVAPGRRGLALRVYEVRRVSLYRSGDRPLRALRLRRMAGSPPSPPALGYTRRQSRAGLVLLERVEDHLVDYILPALAPGARVPLVDPRLRGRAWVRELEEVAAAALRDELEGTIGPAALDLGTLLAERQEVLLTWSRRFGRSGLVIRPPRGYAFEAAAYRGLQGAVPRSEWRALVRVERRLAEDAPRVAYRTLETRLVESVERHELQHRLDFEADVPLPMPPALEARTGPAEVDGREVPRASRARYELSAYVAELARAEVLPKTRLLLLATFLLDRRLWSEAEAEAMVTLFEALAAALHVETQPLVEDRRVMRRRVDRLLRVLLEQDPEALRRGAADAWHALFGRALPPLIPSADPGD
jgi:hypothetical protein